MFDSPFSTSVPQIDADADVIIVADYFLDDYVGGAELTTEALIESASDIKIQKFKASDLSMSILKSGQDKHWVFTNFSSMNFSLIPTIIGNLSYSVIEYDYKFCKYRSIEKHQELEGNPCDCHDDIHGKMISALFHGAKSLWFMSEAQEKRYMERFPFLRKNDSVVLSSVFNDSFFAMANQFNEMSEDEKPERNGWIVLGSKSWIKGADDAEQYCKDNDLEYEVVWDVPYNELLEKLKSAEGFVYLPKGGDTCPRMVIEAKALGCELVLNEHVQHASEEWFTGSYIDMMSYLYGAKERFWRAIKSIHQYTPSVSGYTTVRNANRMKYPWQATVSSMLGFCEEVVVVDGGSEDGTWEELEEWASRESRLVIKKVEISEDHPSFAYETDGKLKATARDLCTKDFCWQMDADEVVHEEDYSKVPHLIRAFPTHCDLVSLPVIEYWGGNGKIRMDVNPWKWRLSRNKPHITQGIPVELRRFDDEGNIYAAPGTDTCDYIHRESGERIPHLGFYNEQAHQVRIAALSGHEEALKVYESWVQRSVEQLPSVHHYSWFNISRKIKQYKMHWASFWKSQYRYDAEDTAENNVMFNKPWSEVTDSDIERLGDKLERELGGWIFHEKVDFSQNIPHITLDTTHPEEFIKVKEKLDA